MTTRVTGRDAWLRSRSVENLSDLVARLNDARAREDEPHAPAPEPPSETADADDVLMPGERLRLLRLAIDRATREGFDRSTGARVQGFSPASRPPDTTPRDWPPTSYRRTQNGHGRRCACQVCREGPRRYGAEQSYRRPPWEVT